VTPREDTWFETPCDDVMTPEFTASLQRALKARGHYQGAVNGRMDGRTQAAIRAYQKPQGLDSGMLSLAAARQMGLMQVDLEDAGIDVPDVAVAELDGTEVQVSPILASEPVAETAAAAAARLAEEREAERLATIEREKQAQEDAAKRAALRAEEETRAAKRAQAEAAEVARIAKAKAAEEARQAAERDAQEAVKREKNKRAKELAQALEEEKERTGGTVFEPLPISSESY
ncbi:MAG: peptidoglycan-binding domain-containing protein, partial [Pseudomonadota bacterium]